MNIHPQVFELILSILKRLSLNAVKMAKLILDPGPDPYQSQNPVSLSTKFHETRSTTF